MFWSYVHPCDRPESLRGDWIDEEEEDTAELPNSNQNLTLILTLQNQTCQVLMHPNQMNQNQVHLTLKKVVVLMDTVVIQFLKDFDFVS